MLEPGGTQYGGFWIRFLAYLVDSAIVFVAAILLVAGAMMALGPEILPTVILAIYVLAFLYWPVMHASRRQATFGKALLGLKVTRIDGSRIGILRSLWREIAKIVSAAVFMIGYIIAGFTPRKQALHDLMASTFVAREGVSRVLPALALAVAGFAAPVVLVPMLLGDAMTSMLTQMAENLATGQDPMKQPAKPPAAPVAKAAPKPAAVQVAKAEPKAEAPKPEPKAEAPKPEAKAEAPKPAAKAEEPKPAAKPEPAKPEAVALAKPEPKPAAKPEPVAAAPKPEPKPAAVAEAPKPKTAPKPLATPAAMAEAKPAEPKPAPAEPKTAPAKVAARPALPAFEPKLAAGPKFNDLMTAVLYRDAEAVTELLRMGKWPDKRDSRGATPLMVAAELGDTRTAEVLLLAGANPYPALAVAEERRDGVMMTLLQRYGAR